MIDRVIIFGATGDLTSRLLMPALAELAQEQELPAGSGARRQPPRLVSG